MTGPFQRLTVPKSDGSDATAHALRLGAYVPDEGGTLPGAYATASGDAGDAASDGVFLRTTGSLTLKAAGLGGAGGVMGFTDDLAVDVPTGDLSLTVSGAYDIFADGVRIAAAADPASAAGGEAPASGTVSITADTEVVIDAKEVVFEAPTVKTSEKTSFFKDKNGINSITGGYQWTFLLGMSNNLNLVMSSTLTPGYVKMGGIDSKMGGTDSKAVVKKIDIGQYKLDNAGLITGLKNLVSTSDGFKTGTKVADLDVSDVAIRYHGYLNSMFMTIAMFTGDARKKIRELENVS